MRLLHASLCLATSLALAAQLGAQRIPTRLPPKAPAKDTAIKAPVIKPALAPAPDLSKYAFLQGVAYDSIHGEPLVGALIQVEGTMRLGATDSLGRFVLDSILPGRYRLLVDHPLIDTLGILLVTDTMRFEANSITRTFVSIPESGRLTSVFCPAARRALGPGALVGRIREPDTEEPAIGARVSIVWYDPDPPGMPANLRVKKVPRVREAVVGADGTYRICGLPDTFEGKLQAQRKDGGATAEVTVSQFDGVLSLRSMSVAALPKLATTDSTGQVVPQQRGSARVIGRVLSATGAPVVGARVDLMGTPSSSRTRTDGTFILDSLPSGTQSVVVRQIGYRPTEQVVELSSRTPARMTIKLGVYVPELTAVEVVSRRDEGLQKVGFIERKRSAASGHFLDPDQIERRSAQMFTDLLRTVPGIRVVGTGTQQQVYSTRSSSGDGCVTFFVDGGKWAALDAGELDSFIRPTEVAAVEVYAGANMPAQFTTSGQNCAAVVIWTKTRVDTRRK